MSAYERLCDLADVRRWQIRLKVGDDLLRTPHGREYRQLWSLVVSDGSDVLDVADVSRRGVDHAAERMLARFTESKTGGPS